MIDIDKDSIFNDLGLKANDVIKAVNGIAMRNTKDAIQAYQKLKSATDFQVDVLRGNNEVTINYSIQ